MTNRDRLYDSNDLAELLAPALGHERADQVVKATLAQLGFPARGLASDEAMAVLRLISRLDGVVGVAGRFALVRGQREAAGTTPRAGQLSPMSVEAAIQLFVPSVGNEKATEVVLSTLAKLQILGDSLDSDQVAALLDAIVKKTGIVSTVARFARARLLLRASEPPKNG